jgi:hypothetical protein
VLPENAFYVQVKSSTEPIDYSEVACRWISHHMDNPLFVCVVTKHDSTLAVYSCMQMWKAVFHSPEGPRSIRLRFDGTPGIEVVDAATRHYEINLGPPVLRRAVAEIEESPSLAFDIFRAWISVDVHNIARRRVGRVAVTTVPSWTTNVVPGLAAPVVMENGYLMGPDYARIERDVAPILTALAHNYRHAKDGTKLEALANMLDKIRPFLDQHGLDFADRKLRVE